MRPIPRSCRRLAAYTYQRDVSSAAVPSPIGEAAGRFYYSGNIHLSAAGSARCLHVIVRRDDTVWGPHNGWAAYLQVYYEQICTCLPPHHAPATAFLTARSARQNPRCHARPRWSLFCDRRHLLRTLQYTLWPRGGTCTSASTVPRHQCGFSISFIQEARRKYVDG